MKSSILVAKRKVWKVASSLVITLPREWTKKHRVTEGDEVVLICDKAVKIVLPPEESL